MTVRLDRLLSTSGISRAEARLAIRAGRVRVNGEVVRDAGAHAEAGDVLVDGRFVLAERSLSLRFRGSRNQRLIDVPKSLESGTVVQIPDN